MGQKKYPFEDILTKQASAGSNDVQMSRIRSGWLYCIQHVAIENETNDCDDVRILKAGAGGEFLLFEEDATEAATLYWIDEDIYLTESQYLLVRFTGCTLADELKVYIRGWRQESRVLDDA